MRKAYYLIFALFSWQSLLSFPTKSNPLQTLVIKYSTQKLLLESNPAKEQEHTLLRLFKMLEPQSNYKPIMCSVLTKIKHAGFLLYQF